MLFIVLFINLFSLIKISNHHNCTTHYGNNIRTFHIIYWTITKIQICIYCFTKQNTTKRSKYVYNRAVQSFNN